ncbi:S-layer homology domain-containing protein [Fusibacter bizertensis]|uniref:S-layer homology domain-containing protein n=1 Tax=Fusibacter bizertensis TaxID=1488331 RepID=A0ABT6NEF0_9FIRM|nr:S-layer homology domain-containing protein [Fusibacter bizertensis]MDH8678804.1 S-layer homology domain-containing protein [Fusibacter bizertensis]
MKKILSIILVAVMLVTSIPSLTATPVYASTANTLPSEQLVSDTIRALGIMTGDTKGNLNLNRLLSRDEFAQMMVNASLYKDSDDVSGGTSVFKDVKFDYWAAEAIKIAVNAGWFTGYLDGTFKPAKYITLEEAATALLKLLGYTNADIVGTYPSAQLSKFYSLGLDEGINLKQGQKVSREDAMYMFYNLMNTKTKEGRYYAETLGHPMLSGEIDYALLVQSVIEGPYVLDDVSIEKLLPFTKDNVSVYKNGSENTLEGISPYDVIYYSKDMRTVWAYSKKITGLYASATPSTNAPNAVLIAGSTYQVGTNEAAYKLSNKGSFGLGDTVTLLVGMNDEIVDVISPEVLNVPTFGVVTAFEPYSYKDSAGKLIAQNSIKVASTDGSIRQFVTGASKFSTGNIVSVTFTNSESVVKLIGSTYLVGKFNVDATMYGNYKLAKDIEILDTTFAGEYKTIYPQRLNDIMLFSNDVRYYSLDSEGAINRLILNNVTGDLNSYGVVTNVDETTTVIDNVDPIPDTVVVSGIYKYLVNGIPGVFTKNSDLLGIGNGPVVLTYKDGQVSDMSTLYGLSLSAVTATTVTANNIIYGISDSVQVYQYIGGDYFLVNLETISNLNEFNLVGYKDGGHRAGNLIRVIIATRR